MNRAPRRLFRVDRKVDNVLYRSDPSSCTNYLHQVEALEPGTLVVATEHQRGSSPHEVAVFLETAQLYFGNIRRVTLSAECAPISELLGLEIPLELAQLESDVGQLYLIQKILANATEISPETLDEELLRRGWLDSQTPFALVESIRQLGAAYGTPLSEMIEAMDRAEDSADRDHSWPGSVYLRRRRESKDS